MQNTPQKLLARIVLLCAALSVLQACATTASPNMEVASAFQTSNVVSLKPYTRTIFSSHDF